MLKNPHAKNMCQDLRRVAANTVLVCCLFEAQDAISSSVSLAVFRVEKRDGN